MATTRGNVHHALTRPVQLTARPITLALLALLAAFAVTLTIALAASGGSGNDQAGYTKSVRVAPSAHIPSPADRNQDPGLNGPGMRP